LDVYYIQTRMYVNGFCKKFADSVAKNKSPVTTGKIPNIQETLMKLKRAIETDGT